MLPADPSITHSKAAEIYQVSFLSLPASLPGRFRQHQVQPMWDASSQSQTTLPLDRGLKNCCRVEKHPEPVRTAEWAQQCRKEVAALWVPPCPKGSGLCSPRLVNFPGNEASSLLEKGEEVTFLINNRICCFCNLEYCNCSDLFHFELYKLLS